MNCGAANAIESPRCNVKILGLVCLDQDPRLGKANNEEASSTMPPYPNVSPESIE